MEITSYIKRNKFLICFSLILFIKFLLAGFFSSDYQDALFMPFVQGWLRNGGNPYAIFADNNNRFPYPPLMLFIEAIGGFLASLFSNSIFLKNVFFKFPLFFFDILCFIYLKKLFPNKRRQITAIYFCSPILLYSTYMHGQLDIIPTALLTGSICFLLSHKKNRFIYSSVLISSALCTKLHILAIFPVLFMFVVKRNGWKKALIYELLIPVIVIMVFVIPFWSDGFVKNVLFNKEQSILTQIVFDFTSLKVYIPILAVLLIYMRIFVVARMNKELFFGFSAILFSVFLILVPPMPGWYVWVLPFLVVFYIDIQSNRTINFFIFSLLNLMYVLYFVFAHDTALTDLSFLGGE